jgi:hypothetical protein
VSAGAGAARDADLRGLDSWEAVDAYRELVLAGVPGICDDAARAVRLLRLEAVISAWIGRRVMVSIHRALAAGADPGGVAAAAGTSLQEIAARWKEWAQGQRLLEARCPGLGLDAALCMHIAAVLDMAGPDADAWVHAR